MEDIFLTSQKATNALSKMRTKACTLEELELTQKEVDELISATGNIKYNEINKTYYITQFIKYQCFLAKKSKKTRFFCFKISFFYFHVIF